MALASPTTVFLAPDGNLSLVLLPSSLCPIIVAKQPVDLEIFPKNLLKLKLLENKVYAIFFL
jgi:hypothetical protein